MLVKFLQLICATSRGSDWTVKGADHGTVQKVDRHSTGVVTWGEGSPGYRSPEVEQVIGELISRGDFGSDMFAVGAMLFTLAHTRSYDELFAAYQCAPYYFLCRACIELLTPASTGSRSLRVRARAVIMFVCYELRGLGLAWA